ncbi:MAG: iron chelate uptake ABC transporter family permease subunit, partial [Alistipes sp.]|nr:iron chelate uptake ABC transporter family permease subunit [Alistipes sp.]
RVLIPASMMTGAVVMLLCDIVSKSLALPINTVTALVGVPIVIFVVIRNRSIL